MSHAIKDLMLGKNINKQKHMLIELFRRHNDQVIALVGKSMRKALIRYLTERTYVTGAKDIAYTPIDDN